MDFVKVFNKFKRGTQRFARIRLKKMHLDYIAGLLSIPVLISAIIINWGNLSHRSAPVVPTVSPSPQVIIVPQNSGNSSSQTLPTSSPICKKSIGPISITSPTEGETISDNPVCVSIDYSDPSYCSVVWSYRINGGSWSDFNNTSPCLYNLPNGTVTVNLRVNSTVSTNQATFTRSFIYNGSTALTPTGTPTTIPTPVGSSSAH